MKKGSNHKSKSNNVLKGILCDILLTTKCKKYTIQHNIQEFGRAHSIISPMKKKFISIWVLFVSPFFMTKKEPSAGYGNIAFASNITVVW